MRHLLCARVDAILIVPKFMHYWAAMLKQLPVKVYQAVLPCYWVQSSEAHAGVNIVIYILTAYLVKFP